MRAVILAAGFGTRLWPLTEDRTKPAIPFLNRPLISYSVQYLAEHGIRRIIINLHHQPESIRDALGDGSRYGAEIEYSLEEEILGTSGALDRVKEKLCDDDFVVMNGKIITAMDLGAAIQHHRDNDALATLVLRPNPARERFSIVDVDSRGWITAFGPHPKPPASGSEPTPDDPKAEGATPQAAAALSIAASSAGLDQAAPLMFTGVQILSPRIFDYIPRNVFSHSTVHVYPNAIRAGEPVISYVSGADWYEMSTLDRYLDASLALRHQTSAPAGRERVVMGRDCAIMPGAEVYDSVLWNQVVVEAGARVRRSIIGDGVRVPSGSNISRAVVVRRERVRDLERATVVGDNLIAPIES
jgi:NDP-sugar pyrophosphorylase family protein